MIIRYAPVQSDEPCVLRKLIFKMKVVFEMSFFNTLQFNKADFYIYFQLKELHG